MTHQDPPITLATCHAFELSGLPNPPQTLTISDGKGGMINVLAFQELLEALQDLLNYAGGWDAPADHPCGRARAAIVKARDAQ